MAIGLVAASGLVLWPFARWMLVALWASALMRPTHARLSAGLGKRPRLAAMTALYVALDVPQALALGLLTLVCSIIPAIGTAIIWVPIAVALWMSDRASAAVILALTGVLVIGTIDNLVRPYIARLGSLQLPTYLVLIAMFGGIELMGARGLIIGPLALRLAKEALALRREAAEA